MAFSSLKNTFFTINVFLIVSTVLSQDDCNPFPACASSPPGQKVIDPNNCHNYYVCVEGNNGNVVPSDVLFQCDNGEYFSTISQSCEYEWNVPCKIECLNFCKFECVDFNQEKIGDYNDCSKYYTCFNGNAIVFNCPETAPYFNGNECSINQMDCCDACCPYCQNSYTETVDPLNCYKFYMCHEKGIPSESDHFPCTEGKYFDAEIGGCQLENKEKPCTPLCSGNSTCKLF